MKRAVRTGDYDAEQYSVDGKQWYEGIDDVNITLIDPPYDTAFEIYSFSARITV